MQYNSVIFICCNSEIVIFVPLTAQTTQNRKKIPALIYKEAPIHSALIIYWVELPFLNALKSRVISPLPLFQCSYIYHSDTYKCWKIY